MKKAAVTVRPALRSDCALLADISAGEHEPWSAEQFAATMDNPLARVWAATVDDQVAGYAAIYFDDYGSELVQIAVAPGIRRRGAGSALMEAVFGFLKEAGIPQIILEVRASNDAAQRLYENAGFRTLRVEHGFYRNPPDDALRMIREIQ